jgi:heavy metal translocating P-type ATPase
VLGGTLNLDGDLTIEVTASSEAGTLARLIELVRQARESKGRYARMADRVAGRFVPAIFAIALGAFGAHWAFGSFERGLYAALAVALIACPCALGLAAPLAIWSALGTAAGRGVLFKSGEALERLSEIVAVRFDKTGVLTTGAPTVSGFTYADGSDRDITLDRAAALADASSHALSLAIVDFGRGRARFVDDSAATDCRRQSADVTAIRVVPGLGVIGSLAGTGSSVALGSLRFMREQDLSIGPDLGAAVHAAESRGLPLSLVGWDQSARGLFVFEESWRARAGSVARWLGANGIDVAVLTGDHAARGRAIARQLGVTVQAELLPAQKVAAVERAHHSLGPVCMIGDGINDAPALAASDAGVALGCGTDVARDAASICLLGDDLGLVPWAIELARRTRRVIRWNLCWAFGYNAFGIAWAAFGWLNPAVAAFLMAASSALVTVNSLRLGQPFEIALDDSAESVTASGSAVSSPSASADLTAELIESPFTAYGPVGVEVSQS